MLPKRTIVREINRPSGLCRHWNQHDESRSQSLGEVAGAHGRLFPASADPGVVRGRADIRRTLTAEDVYRALIAEGMDIGFGDRLSGAILNSSGRAARTAPSSPNRGSLRNQCRTPTTWCASTAAGSGILRLILSAGRTRLPPSAATPSRSTLCIFTPTARPTVLPATPAPNLGVRTGGGQRR